MNIMINLDDLKKADTSFRVCSTSAAALPIQRLCSVEQLMDGGCVLIKNRKYFDKLAGQLDNGSAGKSLGVVFQESFFQECGAAKNWEALDGLRFHGTVCSVDEALSKFSKIFFDDYNSGPQSAADGRQSGSANIHPRATIAADVFLGEGVDVAADVVIHPGCVILANSKVGQGSVLHPNVVLYANVQIGRDCIIHANTTIGSDGFSYNFFGGQHNKVWHFGGVVIEDRVEIGSNSSVDQGTLSPTTIGEGTKIDNQCHVAHNCKVGKGVVICGQSGLAGSVVVGDFVIIGGAVNIAPDVHVGTQARIGGMSGVTGNVPDKADYAGHPARPVQEWLRCFATLRWISARKNRKHNGNNSRSTKL